MSKYFIFSVLLSSIPRHNHFIFYYLRNQVMSYTWFLKLGAFPAESESLLLSCFQLFVTPWTAAHHLQPVQPSAAKQSFLILCFHPVMSLLRNPQGLPTTSITGPHSSLGFQTQCNLVSLSQSDGFPLLVLASPGSTRTGPLPGPCTTCHHS